MICLSEIRKVFAQQAFTWLQDGRMPASDSLMFTEINQRLAYILKIFACICNYNIALINFLELLRQI